jgi:superfamily I DNA/RNA helicase
MANGRREPTAEQRAAVGHRDGSVSLAAGAGTGKTATLTDRYLSHLDRHEAGVGQILAITFGRTGSGGYSPPTVIRSGPNS